MRPKILFLLPFLLIAYITPKAQNYLHRVFVGASEEDAEQEGTFIDINDNELDLGWDEGEMSSIGLFFRDVFIEGGSDIEATNLILTAASDFNDSLVVTIRLENNPYPAVYEPENTLTANRSFFSTTIDWSIPPMQKNEKAYSPELNAFLQPLIDASNWSHTSNLNFVIEPKAIDNDTTRREFEVFSYDQIESEKRPVLRMVVDSLAINGLAEKSGEDERVSIYPNPASQMVNLSSSGGLNQISIFSMNGQLIRSFKLNGYDTSLDISDIESGVYFLSISSDMPKQKLIISNE